MGATCSARVGYELFLLECLKDSVHSDTRRKWKNIVKTDLRETLLEGVNWIHVARDRGRVLALVDTIKKRPVP
jgi:hypothetical protein